MMIFAVIICIIFCYGLLLFLFAKPIEKLFPSEQIKDGYEIRMRRFQGFVYMIECVILYHYGTIEQKGEDLSWKTMLPILFGLFLFFVYFLIFYKLKKR